MSNRSQYLASLFRQEIQNTLRVDCSNIVENGLGFIAYTESNNWGKVVIEKLIGDGRYIFKTSIPVQPDGYPAFNVQGQGRSLADAIKNASDTYLYIRTTGKMPS